MKAFVAVSLAVAAGIFAFAIAAGLLGSLPASFLIGAVAAGLAGWRAWTRPIVDAHEASGSEALKILSGVLTCAALAQLARLTVFMVDPGQVAYSTVPGSGWEVRHSCLSAYFVAGQAAGEGKDVYDAALYTERSDTGIGQRKALMLGPFGIDVYEYPPPFLLVPRVCRLLTTDFYRMRALWFGLSGAVVLFAMLVVTRRLGPEAGARALLLLPVFWAGPAMASTLQKGNIQPVVIALAMLAMILFERRRNAAGGALLAYAIVAKLYPGMLGVYLLGRRQWRAAAWTAAMGVVLLALTLVDVGVPSFAAFMHHLPGLLSGEAFPAFRNAGAQAINISIPGLVFKAGLFGVPGMGFGASKILGWIYTIVVVWATMRAAQRAPSDHEKPLVWMAILTLATLRSPFLPQTYGVLPGLWILTLLAATHAPTAKTLSLAVLAGVVLNIHWPLDWAMDPRVRAALNGLPQGATIALAVLGLRRRVEPEPSTLSA